MKKHISKTIVTIAIVTAFLMPLMGNTALAATDTFYFNSYSSSDWTNPGNMVDGVTSSFAETSQDSDVEELDGNTCPSSTDSVQQVRLRAFCRKPTGNPQIELTPVFGGSTSGRSTVLNVPSNPNGDWTAWVDITSDASGPGTWTKADVANLDCEVKALGIGTFTLHCSKVEIEVTYPE